MTKKKKLKCGKGTHYACECVLDQLSKADELAWVLERWFQIGGRLWDVIHACADYRIARRK